MSGDDGRDDERETPSLEAPSLFGRKRGRKKPPPPPEPTPEPVIEPVAEPVAEPVVERDPPPAPPPAPPVRPVAAPRPQPAPRPAPVVVRDELVIVNEPRVPQEPAAPRAPWLTGRAAAAVTGLVVGALVVGATAGSQRACSAIRGTSSCGGAGFFLLVAILVVAVLVGGAMLRAAQVPEPGSTAVLGVGLVSVVTLVFLVGQLFQWWMAIAIPLVAVVMFLVSHWVTTTYVEPAEG